MSALIPYPLFMQQYPALAHHHDLGKLPADTKVLYVPTHTIIHDVVYVHPAGDLCIIADEYAQVSIISNTAAECQSHVHLYAHKNASIMYTSAHTGSGEQAIELRLLGQGAYITVQGIYGITDTQRYHVTTKQEHCVPGASSSVLIKGIVGGQAVAEYTGTITISEHAHQSNANQQAATLLISPHARSRSIPSLQVLTNDVRCKHGSAVGQLNHDQLFYAQARGLSPEQARQLLMRGFLAQATTHISHDQAAAIVERIITIF